MTTQMLRRPDPREQPAYSPAEAAHYLDIPVSTVCYWSVGRDDYRPLIEPATTHPLVLSFVNLVELHVLSAMRRRFRISMPDVRHALDYVEKQLRLARPLASKRFLTDGVRLFVDHYGSLLDVTQDGQTAMRELLSDALVRVEWDSSGSPIRLFPYTRKEPGDAPNLIVIDPAVSGGRAVIKDTRVAVDVIAERFEAGDSMSDLAIDYGLPMEAVEEAIRCEMKPAA
jgi:uncharacterized protein (DUF433 family)